MNLYLKSMYSSLTPRTLNSIFQYLLWGPHYRALDSLPPEDTEFDIGSFWGLGVRKYMNLKDSEFYVPEHISFKEQYRSLRLILSEPRYHGTYIRLVKLFSLDLGPKIMEKYSEALESLQNLDSFIYAQLARRTLYKGTPRALSYLLRVPKHRLNHEFPNRAERSLPPLRNFSVLLSWIQEKYKRTRELKEVLRLFRWGLEDLEHTKLVLEIPNVDSVSLLKTILCNLRDINLVKDLDSLVDDSLWTLVIPKVLNRRAYSTDELSMDLFRYFVQTKGYLLYPKRLGSRVPHKITYDLGKIRYLQEEGLLGVVDLLSQLTWKAGYWEARYLAELVVDKEYGGSWVKCFKDNKNRFEELLKNSDCPGVYWAIFLPYLPEETLWLIVDSIRSIERDLVLYFISRQTEGELHDEALYKMGYLSNYGEDIYSDLYERAQGAKIYEPPQKRARKE